MRQSGGHSAHKPILVSLLVGAVSASFCSYLYFSPPDFLKRFENQVRDSFFPARRTIKTDPSIVFCNVDDEVLRQIGEWPLPRVYYTELIKNLKDAGMIGFDVLFPEKGMISKKESAQATEKFGSLLQVVQAAFSGEGEQDTVLQQLEKIYQEASNSMAGPDGPLSDAAQKHGRVLFPMAFPEEYPGAAMTRKRISSRLPNLLRAWKARCKGSNYCLTTNSECTGTRSSVRRINWTMLKHQMKVIWKGLSTSSCQPALTRKL